MTSTVLAVPCSVDIKSPEIMVGLILPLHPLNNKPRIMIAIAFFMIPKSYTIINVESVHEFPH